VKRALWAVAALLLAGCAAAPRPGVESPPPVGATVAESWIARGRMAVAVDGEGGSGAFTWRQDASRSELAVRGPLGVGAFNVTVAGDELSMTDGQGVTLSGDEARRQVQARLGAQLPLASLRYWMLGLPAPSPPAQVQDSGSSPVRVVEQDGWRIAYDGFARFGPLTAPIRLTATGPNVRLKLVFDTWQLAPDAGAPPSQ
jgi:outer membrane lipoprotein LolB